MNALDTLFAAAEPAIAAHLAFVESCSSALESLGNEPPPAPRWNQDWFPRLDAAAAYAMVRRYRPRRIIEVGSGHSTRFLARAAADGATQTQITSIDPAPRATLSGLSMNTLRVPVQQAGPAPFAALEPGDFLFIDSSHKFAPGSDVEMLLAQVLPALPGGVLVHFHDIFLPGDYPSAWDWRNYNEQAAVSELLATAGYAIEFSSAWISSRHPQWLAAGVIGRLPLLATAIESSLWLRKLRA